MRQMSLLQSRLWISALGLIFVLLCLWHVPGTISARYSLLAVLLPVSLTLFWLRPKTAQYVIPKWPLIWLALLTGWIVIVILYWGVEPSLSWKEFRGQWLTALGAGFVGAVLAYAALAESRERVMALITVTFWALLIQVLLHDTLDVAYLLVTGEIPFRQAPVLYLPEIFRALWEGRPIAEAFIWQSGDKFSYVNSTLAALVVAELVQRILIKERWLPIGWPLLFLSSVAILVCTFFLQYRNGNVGLLLLISFAILMVLMRKSRQWAFWKTASITGFMLVSLLIFGGVLYKSDARWQTLVETVPIALDTTTHHAWRKLEVYPNLPSGQMVETSAYERFAWAKEGLKLIISNPMGSGYNRNAFGDGIDKKYEMKGAYRGGHSHSGLIDFCIANGIPGLVLLLTFFGGVFYGGWAAFARGQIALGLTIMFVVSGFLTRSIVDSNIRDHMLQEFMFIALLLNFSLPRSGKKEGGLDG